MREGDRITLHFSCHLPDTGEQTGATARAGVLGLGLEELVAQGVQDLRETIGDRPEAQPIEAVAPIPVEADDPPGDVSVQSPPPPLTAVRRFQFMAGAAPFLTTGRAGSYFTTGIAESLYAGYRLPFLRDHLSVGLHLGAYTFAAAGEVASSTNAILPLGVQILLHSGGSGVLATYARVSGGPALFMVTPNGVATLTKLTGYVHAGVGISVMFLPSVGLGIEGGYTLFFESYFPIGGFVPSVFVHMRR